VHGSASPSDVIAEVDAIQDRGWAAHNVRIHTSGVKLLHHPIVGDLDLPFESFPLPADPSQTPSATRPPSARCGAAKEIGDTFLDRVPKKTAAL
jgi:hypothetical protein